MENVEYLNKLFWSNIEINLGLEKLFFLKSFSLWSPLSNKTNSYLIDVRTLPEWKFAGVPDLFSINKETIFVSWQIYPEMNENKNFEKFLYSKDLPEVDLLIRTGGFKRLSNFILWQSSYAELYFTDVLWPNFSKQNFLKSLEWYNSVNRKFGKF